MKEVFYTIGEVGEQFDLPISTIRYYDRQGLLPNLRKQNGIRQFSLENMESIRVIECLKASGAQIHQIKEFMDLCAKGPETFEARHQFFLEQKKALQEKMDALQSQMNMVEFKCWYYDTACKTGSEEEVKAKIPQDLPEDVRVFYERSHPDLYCDAAKTAESKA